MPVLLVDGSSQPPTEVVRNIGTKHPSVKGHLRGQICHIDFTQERLLELD